MASQTRRQYVATVGALAVGATAGCSDGGQSVRGASYPMVDHWLTEDEVGAPAANYDGDLADHTMDATVTITVGARDGQEAYVFEPAGLLVEPGTTLRWEWSGSGAGHNVIAAPDAQLGESDYRFDSGQPRVERDPFELTAPDASPGMRDLAFWALGRVEGGDWEMGLQVL